MPRKPKAAKDSLGLSLIESFTDAVAYERGDKQLKTVERELVPPAPEFSKSQIKKLRTDVLHYTQLEFASLLTPTRAAGPLGLFDT